MKREALTQKQGEVLDNIILFQQMHGYPPTVRELCGMSGVRSTSTIGVRVQGGSIKSDPTANKAVAKIMTTEALIKCDFSGDVLKGVDRAEEFVSDAYLLRKMRNDYQLFNKQVETLGAEKDVFEKYLTGEMSLSDIAELQNISYESAQQKIHKIRSRVRRQVIGFMDGKMGGIA